MAEALFAVDASIYIFRSYFALEPRWHSREGYSTEAVYGFASFLLKLMAAEKPRYMVTAFDESLETGFRHRLYTGYKASRALPDDGLAFQLGACRDVAEVLGITTCGCEEFEADDYLATCARVMAPETPVDIISADKDLAQLLSPRVRLWDYGRKAPMTDEDYLKTVGIPPELVVDLLALTGDASDNIPGVPGVGQKTAVAILQTLGPLDNWLHRPDLLCEVPVRGGRTLPDKIVPFTEQIGLAQQLIRLRSDIPGAPTRTALERKSPDFNGAETLFGQLGLQNLCPRLEALPR